MVVDLGHSTKNRCDCNETGFIMLHRELRMVLFSIILHKHEIFLSFFFLAMPVYALLAISRQ